MERTIKRNITVTWLKLQTVHRYMGIHMQRCTQYWTLIPHLVCMPRLTLMNEFRKVASEETK